MSRRSLQYRARFASILNSGATLILGNLLHTHRFAPSNGRTQMYDPSRERPHVGGKPNPVNCASLPMTKAKAAKLATRLARY